jgi:peptidase E
MKKILLTSAGFENPKIGEEFLKLVNKSAQEIKVLFIPTAARTKEELFYVSKSKEELMGVGIKEENIINFNLDRKLSEEELNRFDVIYICGGNTFYLLHRVNESNFRDKIISLVDKGIVYVGASAGSIIAGPDIEISGRGDRWDKNDIGIKDLAGLNLTTEIISPHYIEEEKEIIDKFREETNKKVTPLRDDQALLIIDDEVKLLE